MKTNGRMEYSHFFNKGLMAALIADVVEINALHFG